jgi:hypothetical protein
MAPGTWPSQRIDVKKSHMRLLLLLALAACILTVLVCSWYYPFGRLSLGFENSGVTVALASVTGDIYPSNELYVRHHWKSSRLVSLNQLRTLVQITDAQSALRYVRIRTSRELCEAWPRPWEVEIVDINQAKTMPSFGIRNRAAIEEATIIKSGGKVPVDWGLTPEDYRAGGFTPAEVKSADSGFMVTRWVFSQGLKVPLPTGFPVDRFTRYVQKIQEFVGYDGTYNRTVLQQQDPPKLSRTEWDIYRGTE